MAGKLQQEIRKLHPFEAIEQEVFLNLQRTADALGREFEETMKARGLSTTQYNVLRILRGAGPAGFACREVGERMVTRDPDVTRLMDRLEKRGLLQRERSVTDRRVVMARITATGLALLKELDEPVMAIHFKQLKHMGSAKLRMLNDLLEAARSGPG